MTESTSEYKKRIEEIKQSIENEPYMAKMREDIAEGISKTGIRQATVEEQFQGVQDHYEATVQEKFQNIDDQFQAVIENTTDKDVISAPEIIVGRGGYATLGERLDEVDAQSIRSVYNYQDKDIIVSFMDDDGNPRLMDTIKPIHESENVPANICVIGKVLNTPSQSVTIEQCQQLKSLGWNVGNHTQNHADMTNYSTAQAEMEIEPVANVLKANGLDHDIIVYPYGGYNKNVLDVARKYNRIGISTEEGINTTPINTFALKRISGIGESGVTLASSKAIIDNAPAGSWIIFKGHTGYDSYAQQQTLDDYLALIQYIKAKGYDIVSIKEGLKRKGNILDIGTDYQKLQISVDGQLRFNNTYEDYSIDNDTPITHFPHGENITYFNNATIAGKGFPAGNNGGTVTTVRLRMASYASEDASYQTFQPYYENTLYRRRWVVGTASWSAWEKISQPIGDGKYPIVNAKNNAYLAGENIVNYPANNITTHRVDISAGFPGAGIVTTYRIGGNGYDRQEFRLYNGTTIYTRYVDVASGDWKDWEVLNAVSIAKNVDLYTGNSPLTDFPADKITTFVSTIGTPNGINGVFTTNRVHSAGYDYQVFKEYSLSDDFKIYVRNVKSGNAWGVWKEIQFVV